MHKLYCNQNCTYRPPDRPARREEEESTNDGVEDGPSIATAASADRTPAKMEAAAKLEANIFELSLLFDIDRDVVVGRAALVLLTEVKAADELIDNAAATIKRLDFILEIFKSIYYGRRSYQMLGRVGYRRY